MQKTSYQMLRQQSDKTTLRDSDVSCHQPHREAAGGFVKVCFAKRQSYCDCWNRLQLTLSSETHTGSMLPTSSPSLVTPARHQTRALAWSNANPVRKLCFVTDSDTMSGGKSPMTHFDKKPTANGETWFRKMFVTLWTPVGKWFVQLITALNWNGRCWACQTITRSVCHVKTGRNTRNFPAVGQLRAGV